MATNHGRHPAARLDSASRGYRPSALPTTGVAQAVCVARTADNDTIRPVDYTSIGLVDRTHENSPPAQAIGDGDHCHVTTRLCPHSRDANDAPCPNGRTPSPVELRGSLLGTCPTEAQVGEPTFGPTSSSCPASPKPRTLFAPCERLRVGVHRPVDHRGSEVTPAWLLDTTSGRSGSRTCDDHPRRIWSILHQSPPGRPSSPRGSHAEPGSATLRAGDDPTPTRAAPVGTSTWASEDPTPTCAPCGDHRDCG